MGSYQQKKYLNEMLLVNGYDFSVLVRDQLWRYLELLIQWNRVFNLTAIRDPQAMVLLHILDSLSISPYLYGIRLIDVGTGAGLPGIPLALTQPDKQWVLLDSNSKKTRFLTQVIAELKLTNLEVVQARCDTFNPGVGFDSVISRAFASIEVMLETTQHLVRTKGQFLAMKGVYPREEIAAIPASFKLLTAHKLIIQGLDAERHLIRIASTE